MPDAYLRFPHVHRDRITFVAEDDVWLVSSDGGRAWRLSADRVPATHPYFAPDGSTVAWTSTREGAPEVFVAPSGGGSSRRLTYWGARRTMVRGWTPSGDVIAVTEAGRASPVRTWAHAVPADGGPSRPLPYGIVHDVAYGEDNAVLVASPAGIVRDVAYWKGYRGGTAARLWLDRAGNGEFDRLLPNHLASLTWPVWAAGRFFVVSDHEGLGQVYALDGGGTELTRLTDHHFYVRHLSTDGRRLVYAVAGELWTIDDPTTDDVQPRRVEVTLGSDRPGRQPQQVTVSENLGDVVPDETGRASAIEVRGTVHWVTHRDGPVRTLADESGARARLPVHVGTDRVAWVTDADGEDGIEIVPRGGATSEVTPRRLAGGQVGRVLELAASPDGSVLAVACHDGRLLVVDVGSGAISQVLHSDNGDVSGLAFSPDSAWLAWSQPGLSRMGGDIDPLRHIRMARLADLEIVDVTSERFTDLAPVFTRDGKHLAFLSVRSFDPVYDAYSFDLSFPNGCRPYLVPLAADTPSPFDAELLGRAPDGDSGSKGDDESSSTETPATVVDPHGLEQRVRPFPVPAARYSGLRPIRHGVVWLREPLAGELGDDRASVDDAPPRPAVERYDLKRRRCEVVAEAADDVRVSGDGARLVITDKGSLRVVPSDGKVATDDKADSGQQVSVDLDRVRVRVDPAAEWRQAFDEAGRLMRDHYWRADLGGLDWAAELDRYRPLVDRIGSHDDLVDVLWEVQGELGTSHAYAIPPNGGSEATMSQGLLGADLRRDDDGTWRVARVLPGESSDPRARSPLLAPGVGVGDGDAVLAVDGRRVDPDLGPNALLVGAAGKPVELTIGSGTAGTQSVVVTPVADETPLRYHDWVSGRRAYVRERSEGRLGYLHVPDMGSVGWAQLHRDLRVELARDGVVVDVRENGGGHTSQLVVEKLARRIIGWDLGRHKQPEPYPLDAPRGPVVVVTNEFAGSDGDIVCMAVQAYDIGPVVGMRTWGGVVGIDMRYQLVDGTIVTQPRYSFWFEDAGWGVENYGVDPDIAVEVSPQDRVAGRDPQLDTAIDVALRDLAERPPATPPTLPT